ncbi:MAG: hypothetical protein ACO1QB_14290 [Verrucomicrobiales bacterium]
MRQQITTTLQWIASALRMGSGSYLHNLLAGRQKTDILKHGNNKEPKKNKVTTDTCMAACLEMVHFRPAPVPQEFPLDHSDPV